MFDTGRSARQIVEARGLAQISDTGALEQVVARVLDENREQVAHYLEGKEQLIGWFIGQVMKLTRGKANPQMVRELLQAQLEAHRERSKD
jgi:aspartyl-tRNA(Asn)/glutamyl-tRNA(Gln) amidotransferase subunit B